MKKIGFVMLAMVLALGSLGIGYAMWYDEVEVDGTIYMGTVDVHFAGQVSNDPPPTGLATGEYLDPNDDPWPDVGDPTGAGSWDPYSGVWTGDRTKNVASIDCSFYDGAAPGPDEELMTITVENGYPCYYGSILFAVHNQGTTPVALKDIRLLQLSKGTQVWDIDPGADPPGWDVVPCTWYYVRFDGPTAIRTTAPVDPDDWEFSFHISEYPLPDYPGCDFEQIDYCESGIGDVTVHIEQSADEDEDYDFSLKFIFCNWNEPGLP
jgi:hypothetical protein